MRQLSLVVTCTDRKMVRPTPSLQARNLPEGSTDDRVELWGKRLEEVGQNYPLTQLYQGEHWVQVRGLVDTATSVGFSPQLWVASAGLGLQPVSSTAPSYAATFGFRHTDSVAPTRAERTRWWGHLQELRGATTLSELVAQGPVLLALSEIYAAAMHDELRLMGQWGGDVLLIGGERDIPGIHRVPANSALRRALGGTLTSLNVRMAISWLRHWVPGWPLTSTETASAWKKWVAESECHERYQRTPMTDEEIRRFILAESANNPGYSRTRLHRLLRESGRACEQKRFALLYAETMEK